MNNKKHLGHHTIAGGDKAVPDPAIPDSIVPARAVSVYDLLHAEWELAAADADREAVSIDTIRLCLGVYKLRPGHRLYVPHSKRGDGVLWIDKKSGEMLTGQCAVSNVAGITVCLLSFPRHGVPGRTVECIVRCSLPKLYHGSSNLSPVPMEALRKVFKTIQQHLTAIGIDTNILEARVSRLDVFRNWYLKYAVSEYQPVIARLTMAFARRRLEFPTGVVLGNLSREFGIYDKQEQMLNSYELKSVGSASYQHCVLPSDPLWESPEDALLDEVEAEIELEAAIDEDSRAASMDTDASSMDTDSASLARSTCSAQNIMRCELRANNRDTVGSLFQSSTVAELLDNRYGLEAIYDQQARAMLLDKIWDEFLHEVTSAPLPPHPAPLYFRRAYQRVKGASKYQEAVQAHQRAIVLARAALLPTRRGSRCRGRRPRRRGYELSDSVKNHTLELVLATEAKHYTRYVELRDKILRLPPVASCGAAIPSPPVAAVLCKPQRTPFQVYLRRCGPDGRRLLPLPLISDHLVAWPQPLIEMIEMYLWQQSLPRRIVMSAAKYRDIRDYYGLSHQKRKSSRDRAWMKWFEESYLGDDADR